MNKRFGIITLTAITVLSSWTMVSAAESKGIVQETKYNTAQFVPANSTIEQVLKDSQMEKKAFDLVKPYSLTRSAYSIASSVTLMNEDYEYEAPWIRWWSTGYVSVIEKATHDGVKHYTTACVISKQSSGTIYATSGRQWGTGKVPATSGKTLDNGEARIFYGW